MLVRTLGSLTKKCLSVTKSSFYEGYAFLSLTIPLHYPLDLFLAASHMNFTP